MRDGLPAPVQEALRRVPDEPGCYRMLDAAGTVLYVGKARSLRPRVRSYFQESAQHEPRIAALVQEVRSLDFIVTRSEVEALILENNLIKEHRPRYNVLLRDDKNFPYLKLAAGDAFPRVVLVRRPRADGSLYFGPFLPASHAWRTLRMIPRFFQVANCHLRFDGKQRPCLYYHLDQCLAPCAGKADPAEYAERVREARLFLEGRDEELHARIEARMHEAAAALEFERAARYRDMLASLKTLSQKQGMTSVGLGDVDFWAEHREEREAAVELFRMRAGRVVGRREFTLADPPPPETFYDTILPQFYAAEEPPPEIVLPRLPAETGLIEAFLRARRAGQRVQLRAPTHGERRRFLDLVAQNAKLAFEARFRAAHVHGVQTLEDLRNLLGLDEVPFRIEGFDVAHLQGSEPRAAMVVFEGGRPKKADYRIFKVTTAAPGDDYQAMREVVARRYARLHREGKRLPDLVLIDGGKGQLAAARQALAEVELDHLNVVALAKREEEIFLEGRGEPVLLERHDPALHLVQQIRDEAHRFAGKHHRAARAKRTLQSRLTAIDGVGPTTARRLLQQFGSVDGIGAAPDEALVAAVGRARAAKVRAALSSAAMPAADQPAGRPSPEPPPAGPPPDRPHGGPLTDRPFGGAPDEPPLAGPPAGPPTDPPLGEPPPLRSGDQRVPVPPGACTFDLLLGDLRVRIADLPTPWEPFVTAQYAPFAEPPGAIQPGLVIRCREGQGEVVPLPSPGGSTIIELERRGPTSFRVRSHWQDGSLDLDAGEGELILTDRAWDRFSMSVENYLRVALQLASIERGAFLLHSACILDDGRAVLFFGHSGAGKSTATAFSLPRPALSDDMVLLDIAGPRPVARAVPFYMVFPPEQRARGSFPVAAALRLRQAPEDKLVRLSPATAVATVSGSVPFVHELGISHEGVTALVTKFCAAVPVFDMHFTKSARFWDLLRAEI